MTELKLPRQVESDPRRQAIEDLLAKDRRALWDGGKTLVSHIDFTPALEQALERALNERQIERGLENIEKVLYAQKKGIDALRDRDGSAPASRVSRLLVIPDGSPERFYRNCESVLYNHADRVLGLRVNVPFERFGQKLFGKDALIKVLLVSERESVSNVLFSLVKT